MKYFANFLANNNERLINDRTGNNKKELIRSIRNSAEAHRQAGNETKWSVTDEKGRCVAAGGMLPNGQRYRISDAELYYYGTD